MSRWLFLYIPICTKRCVLGPVLGALKVEDPHILSWVFGLFDRGQGCNRRGGMRGLRGARACLRGHQSAPRSRRCNDDGDIADALFRNAEAALKEVKLSGTRYPFHTTPGTA